MIKPLVRRAFFWVSAFFLLFFMLGQIPVWSPDEGRFAGIARDLWASKDFILLRFHHIPFLEKPILAYFLTSLSMGLLGPTAVAARLVSVLAALAGLFMMHRVASRWFGAATAALASVILLTTVGYVMVGRFAVLDMLQCFLMSGAFLSLGSAYFEKRLSRYLAAYVFIGLSLITKGLIGVLLPGATFLIFLVLNRDLGEIRRMRLGVGFGIVALIFVPWAAAVSVREPEFFRVFIIEQHFARFSTGVFGRQKPFWFFIPILFLSGFPWSVFLPAAVVSEKDAALSERIKHRFLLTWFLVIFIFFSMSRSKLPYYILPASVPMALLVAVWMQKALDPEGPRRLLRGLLIMSVTVLSAASLSLTAYLWLWAKDPRMLLFRGWSLWAVGWVFIGVGASLYQLKKRRDVKALFSLAATVYGVLLLMIMAMPLLTPHLSTLDEARLILGSWREGDRVAVFGSPDSFSDLPFHLGHRVIVVGSDRGTLTQELEEPEHAEEAKEWFPDAGAFVRAFNAPGTRYFLLSKIKNIDSLKRVGLNRYKELYRAGGKILITNES